MSRYVVPKRYKGYKTKTSHSQDEGSLFDTIKRLFVLGIAILLAGWVGLKLYIAILPPIANLSEFKPNMVTKFLSSDGEIIKTFNACTFSKAETDEIPKPLKQAIIATEDKNFYHHPGYDLCGVARSMVENAIAGRVVQGGSTITQQLSRMLFLSNEQSYTRKVKEIIIAAQIEKSLTKDQILTMYLNNVYLGAGAYGVDGAAQMYFNKHLNQLSLSEMALLAGLPQAPSVYSPFNNPKLAKKRRNQVLQRMYKMNYIDKDTMLSAQAERIHLAPVPSYYLLNKAPYFCDYVMRELEKLGFSEQEISQGGYKIVTTLDYKTQIKANESIISQLNAWGLSGEQNQAAVFAFSPVDGKILAYAGGKDYSKSQYDRVTQAIRPPGSAFKPFIYTAAVEKGLSPNDMIDDKPFSAGSWTPHNYGNRYRGKIPVYKALMISSNVCAARVIQYVGVRAVIQIARIMGITTPLEYDYTIALGSNGVKLFELTRAYGIFANGGFRVEPYAIERIESSRGKVLYSASRPKITKVLSTDTAAIMTAMLKTVIEKGTGVAANIGKPAAGKTGTTDNYKDAWFVGYTPTIVAGVWVGNDNNTKMRNLTGGTVPALIWKDVVKVAIQTLGSDDFGYPDIPLDGVSRKSYSNSKLINSPDRSGYQHYVDSDYDNQVDEVPMSVINSSRSQSRQPASQYPGQNYQQPSRSYQSPTSQQAPIPMAVPNMNE